MFKQLLTILLALIIIDSTQAQSFYSTDFTSSSTINNNIYKDSSNAKDRISSLKSTINFYPLSFAQYTFFSEYTNYGLNPNLSNLNYGGSLSILPLSKSSNFTLFLNLNYKRYDNKEVEKDTTIGQNPLLNNVLSTSLDTDVTSMVSLSYQLNDRANIRTAFTNSSSEYTLNNGNDKSFSDLFAGVNFSTLGSNSVDVEFGYSFEEYKNVPEYITLLDTKLTYGINPTQTYSILQKSDLKSRYLSIRYSRPIGAKTGLSLTYSYREFTDTQDSSLVYGKSTGHLSPWLNSYEGSSMQLKLKSYMIPRVVLNLGLGYWDRTYLRTAESILGMTSTAFSEDHADELYRAFVSFSLPIVTASGRLFEPLINIDYSDNKSDIDLYKYDNLSITFSLNIK